MSGWTTKKDPEAELLWGIGLAAAAVLLVALTVLVEWPVLVASSVRGRPTLMAPAEAVAGGVRWIAAGLSDPRSVTTWQRDRSVLPSPAVWFTLDALLLLGVVAVGAGAAARVDRWRGRREVAVPSWHPRSRVTARTWAKPRDLLHLQQATAMTSRRRFVRNGVMRAVRRERAPLLRPDSWPLGRLRGAELRSGPESHLMAVAPTRSGKTTRVLIPALLEHDGPAIVLSNKTDVFEATVRARAEIGPVFAYAPMTPPEVLRGHACGWTPLAGCERWDYALRMSGWLLDADPGRKADVGESGGARFYNREAQAVALPPLLHAAALGHGTMGDVQDWLRGGPKGLNVPLKILEEARADQAADSLAGLQALEDRPRSLVMMSASQLVDVYRFPAVRAADRDEYSPHRLADNGTLYLIAPDGEQEMLAPVFGGIIGATLRTWERHAGAHRQLPMLRILADEAAHLAPLAKLPTYLAVSASWNVRWCLIYQSLAQVRDRYGVNADTILANVLAKLFMGPILDETTRRYLVDLLDEETVTARSWAAGSLAQTSRHERQASKISAQPLQQLGVGEAVMMHGRDLPAITRLAPYWELR